MEEGDDPYKILGVGKDATSVDVKKAYRSLALKNHPDKQTTDLDRENASAVFAKIAAAYEILSDEEERKQHDLRQKHGGAPGTRYTTCGDSDSQPSYSQPQTPFRQTTSRTRQAQPMKQQQTSSSPESGTFSFSYDPSKARSSDPYAIFKEVFGSDFQTAYPGAVLSPSRTTRGTNLPASPSKAVRTQNLLASPSKTVRTQNGKPKMSMPSFMQPTKSKFPGGAQCRDDVVSMSSSTKTIFHDDGTQEIITERTITTADGSTKVTRESSRSSGSSVPQMPGNPMFKSIHRPSGRTQMSSSVSK